MAGSWPIRVEFSKAALLISLGHAHKSGGQLAWAHSFKARDVTSAIIPLAKGSHTAEPNTKAWLSVFSRERR